ncbi:hypothetical protein N7481_001556 [Penicillium waksmanii]|uniref:uncharacterized protein n=1 Tax=Penicillium waksmanii TaxID=69791 RepID=UPI0025466ECE|nr:uncharacterized protein N7481_001556 [Penicillium waksmanii]KAJ6001147.1 hypothetical protein N7481_001556 [Penicillium waksmanii]
MPVSILDSVDSNPLTHITMEAYTLAMVAHTQSQISSLVGLSENHGAGQRNSRDVPTSGVRHQRPIPPNTTTTEAARRQACNETEYTQA